MEEQEYKALLFKAFHSFLELYPIIEMISVYFNTTLDGCYQDEQVTVLISLFYMKEGRFK